MNTRLHLNLTLDPKQNSLNPLLINSYTVVLPVEEKVSPFLQKPFDTYTTQAAESLSYVEPLMN